VHRAAAIGNPIGSAQPSQSLTIPGVASAESQAAVASVATAVRVDQCTGCAACESACLQGAISVDRFVTVDESLCTGCGDCVDVCAFDVLALQPR
jgi:Fe-S-cluster-containing hydrogenase component 2